VFEKARALEARIKAQEKRGKAELRAAENRVKFILGGIQLVAMKKDPEVRAEILEDLRHAKLRDQDIKALAKVFPDVFEKKR
jgi:hypothetical protein